MNLWGEGKKSILYSTSFIPRRLKDFSCKVRRSEEDQIYFTKKKKKRIRKGKSILPM
jgi:hypothetical protein